MVTSRTCTRSPKPTSPKRNWGISPARCSLQRTTRPARCFGPTATYGCCSQGRPGGNHRADPGASRDHLQDTSERQGPGRDGTAHRSSHGGNLTTGIPEVLDKVPDMLRGRLHLWTHLRPVGRPGIHSLQWGIPDICCLRRHTSRCSGTAAYHRRRANSARPPRPIIATPVGSGIGS